MLWIIGGLVVVLIAVVSYYSDKCYNYRQKERDYQKELEKYKKYYETREETLKNLLSGNLNAIPYFAGMMADFMTYDLEVLARELKGSGTIRYIDKATKITAIRKEAREKIAAAKEAEYQLQYILNYYPALNDFLETEYTELHQKIDLHDLKDHDYTRDYLTREEYNSLSGAERNQLALDRYVESHKKSKWQIGRDYELYVGYQYRCQGYRVKNYGELKGLEDLGRDLICKKFDKTLIVQCKYWSQEKTIHEKHICQLYGTTVSYCLENNIPKEKVKGVFVTNIKLSEQAKRIADYLGIEVIEDNAMGEFPRIKCNYDGGEFSCERIYHLPMDQQYDTIDMTKPSTRWAMTVEEAENLGFRRAYAWHGRKAS